MTAAAVRPSVIRQPGAPHPERMVSTAGVGHSFRFVLEAGLPLLEAVRRGLAAEGYVSGVVEIGALALGPFGYVMPGLPVSPANAAYYTQPFRPAGITRLSGGAMTLGLRDGAAFFHCHGLWREADGKLSGGHILPEEAIVAEPAEVTALGIARARFEAAQDDEINFKVFGPLTNAATPPAAATGRVVAVRLRPNQDFHAAVEAIAARHGVARARIRGGVGSVIGARFSAGREIVPFVTEAYIRAGSIAPGTDGRPVASIDVGLVDNTGVCAQGPLERGANPILMTFELALEEIA